MLTLTFIICMFCALLAAPPTPCAIILVPEVIKPYEGIWNATCAVESNFNPLAVGDKHLTEHSYGIVQIRGERLMDYFKETGIRYTVFDMLNPIKAKRVFMHYCMGTDMEVIARRWNGGTKGMEKEITYEYWLKIQSNLK